MARLGQHLLYDKRTVERFISSVPDVEHGINIVEIGPGKGILTEVLLQKYPDSSLCVFEYDHQFEPYLLLLQKKYPDQLRIIWGDVLKYNDWKQFGSYVCFGNIPYYISRKIVTQSIKNHPLFAYFLVQEEFAQKVFGSCDRFFTVFTNLSSRVSLGEKIPRQCFVPPPRVDSQGLLLDFRNYSLLSKDAETLLRNAFIEKRKYLFSFLLRSFREEDISQFFQAHAFSKQQRIVDTSLDQWKLLINAIYEKQFQAKEE
jgi:16S rRNA (adenine1518-N6/adenine1519-N6)-dimethyltransferase